jgi:DNA-binding transcriptional LysR family regulator
MAHGDADAVANLPWSTRSEGHNSKASRWGTRASFNLGDIEAISNRKAFPPFAALKAFEMIGRLGGIRKAALALGIDHAAVSRHLRSLEEWAGVPLVDRSRGGSGRLTPEGSRYHLRVSSAFAEISSAGLDLIQKSDVQRLHLWCSPGFAYQWLVRVLDRFKDSAADIDVDLRPTDFGPNFARGEAMADIRFVGDWLPRSFSQGIQTAELARPIVIPVASPKFLANAARPAQLEDLLALPLLHEEDDEQWRAWFANQSVPVLGYIRGTRLWHAHLAVDAARRGQGIALANHFLVAEELQSGELVEVKVSDRRYRRAPIGSYVLAAREDRWRTPMLTRFRSWLNETIDQELETSAAS